MNRTLRASALGIALAVGVLVGGTGAVFAAPAAPSTSAPSATSQSTAAIQQVIRRSNAEQAQALSTRDASVMADTATADHLQELQQVNQDLLNGGVAAIQLTRLEWGPITVNGSSANATTYETWTVRYRDGSTQQSRDTNVYTLVQDNGAWKIQTNTHPSNAPAAPTTPSPRTSPGAPTRPNPSTTSPAPTSPTTPTSPTRDTSHNWSGYAANGGNFTSVTGTWTIPNVQSTGAPGVGATWVGIGGVTSRDLIQAGTQETDGGNGRVQYSAWVETLPQASRPVPFVVRPGDSVTVTITEQSANNWQIAFKNNSTGKSYETTTRYSSSHSSAEWVVEAPSSGNGILPLDNFGSVAFTDASATQNGKTVNLSQAKAQPITMLSGSGQALAVPSGIGGDGSSFSVARTTAAATSGTAGGRRGFGGGFGGGQGGGLGSGSGGFPFGG